MFEGTLGVNVFFFYKNSLIISFHKLLIFFEFMYLNPLVTASYFTWGYYIGIFAKEIFGQDENEVISSKIPSVVITISLWLTNIGQFK